MPSAASGPVSAPAMAIDVVGGQVALPSPAGSAAVAASAAGTSFPAASICISGSMDSPPAPGPSGSLADLSPQPARTNVAAAATARIPRTRRLRRGIPDHVETNTIYPYVPHQSPAEPG